MTCEYNGWAVLIRCNDGREFLSASDNIPPSVFRTRREALEHADQCAEHIPPRRRMKAVRVKLNVEILS